MIASENMETSPRTGGLLAWVKAIACRFARANEPDEMHAVRSQDPGDLRDLQSLKAPGKKNRDSSAEQSLPIGPCCC
jgi:hypothetical protein